MCNHIKTKLVNATELNGENSMLTTMSPISHMKCAKAPLGIDAWLCFSKFFLQSSGMSFFQKYDPVEGGSARK